MDDTRRIAKTLADSAEPGFHKPKRRVGNITHYMVKSARIGADPSISIS
jgi:hypothetical protein